MVNLPPDPNQSDSSRFPLGWEEMTAVAVAFLSMGAILLWGFTRDAGPGQMSLSAVSDRLNESMVPAAEPDLAPAEDSEAETTDTDDTDRLGGGAPSAWRLPADIPDQERRSIEPAASAFPPALPELTEILPAAPDENEAAAPAALDDAEEAAPDPEATVPEDSENSTEAVSGPVAVIADDVAESLPVLSIADVPEDYWAYPFIQGLFTQGLLPDFPSGEFEPEKPLTRAELAALVSQAFLPDDSAQPVSFSDVSEDYWAAEAIAKAVAANFMSGYPEGDFRPDQLVPRYQVLVTLASGLGLRPVNDPQATLQLFEDPAAIPAWAQTPVAAATENGLVVNYPNRAQMRPQSPATRAEIVAMLYQALEATGQVEPVPSQYAVSGTR